MTVSSPAYRAWAAWNDRGRLPKDRPPGIPKKIPAAWWHAYKAAHVPKPQPVRMPSAGPWEGVGILEAADWTRDIDRIKGLDYVMLQTPVTSDESVAELRAKAPGVRVTLWDAWWTWQTMSPQQVVDRVRALGAVGWVGEVETPLQDAPGHVKATGALLDQAGIAKALTGPNFQLCMDGQTTWTGWTEIIYAYCNDIPTMTPDAAVAEAGWHMAPSAPQPLCLLLGGYDRESPLAADRPASELRAEAVATYRAQVPALKQAGRIRGVCMFIGTSMNDAEWALMHDLKQQVFP